MLKVPVVAQHMLGLAHDNQNNIATGGCVFFLKEEFFFDQQGGRALFELTLTTHSVHSVHFHVYRCHVSWLLLGDAVMQQFLISDVEFIYAQDPPPQSHFRSRDSHTHTHTHTQRDRERERERQRKRYVAHL